MLKARLLTALFLIPIVVFLLYILSPIPFCIFTSVIVLFCAWEWGTLLGLKTAYGHAVYTLLILALMLVTLVLPIPMIMVIAGFWWMLAAILVLLYPRAKTFWNKGLLTRGLMGVLTLIPCWLAINRLRNVENGFYTLLFLFILVWGVDSAAYFFGRVWGRHKLAPRVSPGKTIEGTVGAFLTTAFITGLACLIFKIPQNFWLAAFALSLTTVMFSIMGDLFESMLKREVGIKDSGQILPGHGGILDRIDSLTAAAPIFTLGALWLAKIN